MFMHIQLKALDKQKKKKDIAFIYLFIALLCYDWQFLKTYIL